jgi:membrane fusion protein (multidrug efflux system)
VKVGDLMFQIDPRPFEAALAQAKGQLAQAEAIQLASAADYERSKALFAKKVISEKEYVNKTQLNLSNLAKVEALTANLEQARLNLNFCKITAPINGVAGIAQAQVGDLVGGSGSNSVLTTVSTLDPIKIVFPISEGEYLIASQRLMESMNKPLEERPEAIEVVLADGSIFPHKGRLLSVDLSAKETTGTILVTGLVPNPGSVLRPGFFAKARVMARILKGAVVVPQRALNEVQGNYQLAVVGADGKAEIRPVKAGTRVGTDRVIDSGLKPGETVVVEGLQKVKAEQPVVAKPWQQPQESKEPEAK